MIKTPVHNLEGQVKGEIELQGEVFGLPPNPAVVHQAVVRHAPAVGTTCCSPFTVSSI